MLFARIGSVFITRCEDPRWVLEFPANLSQSDSHTVIPYFLLSMVSPDPCVIMTTVVIRPGDRDDDC